MTDIRHVFQAAPDDFNFCCAVWDLPGTCIPGECDLPANHPIHQPALPVHCAECMRSDHEYPDCAAVADPAAGSPTEER